ncbi:hypothetical protein CLV97_110109 [Planifilum fimeticola]|uniref:Uncharacterized protein n=1 Tax=Planifilum fimeticola TaxID=201975 RepID=A0A2T0LFD9_9BACL|nr:hypothetical protein [Planifilum fimeticola]PRX40917.1 hypothetical protein CLV97_110109 [Planifilum fimeticola]
MDRIRSVIKRYGIVVAVTVAVTAAATTFLLTVYGEEGEEKGSEAVTEAERLKREKDLEAADQIVYEWIAARVEADDDRQSKVMFKEEIKKDIKYNIIKPGRHEFPGAEEKMGERYLIERYDKYYEDGKLFYRIKYYHPNNDKTYVDYLLVEKEDGKWKATNRSEVIITFSRLFPERKNVLKAEEIGGVTVHEMKE